MEQNLVCNIQLGKIPRKLRINFIAKGTFTAAIVTIAEAAKVK